MFGSEQVLFFFLDKKEPKNQDRQEKSPNSAARCTKILKLVHLPADSNIKNFGRSTRRNLLRFFLNGQGN